MRWGQASEQSSKKRMGEEAGITLALAEGGRLGKRTKDPVGEEGKRTRWAKWWKQGSLLQWKRETTPGP